MTVKYSTTKHACYASALNYPNLPDDLIVVPYEEYEKYWLSQPPEGARLKKNCYPFEYEDIDISFSFAGLAKITRDASVSADILIETLDNSVFQCTNQAEDIKAVINEAEAVNALETDTIMFRLSNNTWREVSLVELRSILQAFILRKKSIWEQFAVWDNGEKTSPFEYVNGIIIT